jgi:hypothetical protein
MHAVLVGVGLGRLLVVVVGRGGSMVCSGGVVVNRSMVCRSRMVGRVAVLAVP